MQSTTRRLQIRSIASGYAAVLVVAATLLYGRHLQELKYPAEASGGMWAAGDALLYIFIACLFMVPTVFLIWVTARFEAFYTPYSKFLLGLSLSAPACLSVLFLGENHAGQSLITLCLYRLIWSPYMLVAMGMSRLATRFDRAKRLLSYSLFIEGLTLAIAVALVIHAWGGHKNR
jgi:hypothetical protein